MINLEVYNKTIFFRKSPVRIDIDFLFNNLNHAKDRLM